MVDPAIKQQILNDLVRLSPEKQRRALELVHSLVEPSPEGATIEDLLTVAGTLDKQSAREMRSAIEEHCERIDPAVLPHSPTNPARSSQNPG